MIMKIKTLVSFLLFSGLLFQVSAQQEDQWKKEVDRLIESRIEREVGKKGMLVLTGSSSARLWKNVADVFPEYTVVNNGFGGSQMHELLYYLDDLVIDLAPDIVLIYEGDNDIVAEKSSLEIIKATKEVIHKIKASLPQTEVFLISPKPSLARWELAEKYLELNKELEALCKETDLVSYIDVWFPMLNQKGLPMEDIFVSDGLHMNEKGYQIWTDAMIHITQVR